MRLATKATLEELPWKAVRNDIAKKNDELANIIDEINPSSEYTLFKACYPFGSEILKDGYFFIPNAKGSLVPLNSADIPAPIQDKLNYNLYSNPVSLILNNTAELFIILKNTTIPFYGLISPERIFGTWRILNPKISQHPNFIWNMVAGARSIFMLPKISETAGYNRLRRAFHLHSEKPKTLLEHWKIFREIANHPDFGEIWSTEMLFFSKKWFDLAR